MSGQRRTVSLDIELLERLTRCSTEADLRASLAAFGARYGFATWIYGIAGPTDVALTNYPIDWRKQYIDRRLHRTRHDPVIETASAVGRSIVWDADQAQLHGKRLSRPGRQIMALRKSFSLRAGITAPAISFDRRMDWAILSFSRDFALPDRESFFAAPAVQLFASYFHSVAATVMMPRAAASHTQTLSQREKDCLSWVAGGKTSWEIGKILAISHKTVDFHVAAAARKLGVYNRHAATAAAIRGRFIDPF